MRLTRIDQSLEICEEHLTRTVAYGTAIENLLTQSVLVIMCAEFEQAIERLIAEKCSSVSDPAIRDFIGSCVGTVFRSVKFSEMAGLLKRFGPPLRDAFKDKTDNNPRAVTYYNNIVENRHGVAHSAGSNVTFIELKKFYEEGHIVLDFFRDSLLISQSDSPA
ncbi:MAG: HEPN domain-containing protein [Methylococcales bacterium]